MIPFEQLQEFLRFLSIPFLSLNFIDILIIIIVALYAIEGYALGFIRGVADFLSFILSFIFGLSFYGVFGKLLIDNVGIPQGFGNALGFFIAAFLAEIALTIFFRSFILPSLIPKAEKLGYSDIAEKWAGIIPGVLSSFVLLAFVLTMIIALPLSPFLKNSVSESRFGGFLVSNVQGFDEELNKVFGGAVNDALTFLTVEPKSEELLKLNFTTDKLSVDRTSEQEMLELVNRERTSRGLSAVTDDVSLREVGRKHCEDMFKRGYFSHYTPEGKSPFDRMAEDDISFRYAGENLALAPNTELAMQGLMNSPGHKANILSENFGKLGIGVIDGGGYGKMFCQEFTD